MQFLLRLFPVLPSAIALAIASLLTACGTGGATVMVPVIGGSEKVRVEFTSRGPAHAKADGFEVLFAGFINNPAPKPPDYGFTLAVKDALPPKRIIVDDITEETSVHLLTDDSPAVKEGVWHNLLATLDPHDPRIDWLYRMNNDLRIYRITITASDGHVVVLDQAANYPAFIKGAIRIAFGEKL